MNLIYYPDPRLYELSKKINAIDSNIKKIAREMFEIMYKNRGIGLAGPQVGFNSRIIVVNLTGKKCDEKVFVNPEIITRCGKAKMEEGCLSIPMIKAEIIRAKKVCVGIVNLEGKYEKIETEDLYARVLQHEIDHLNGVLIIDRMSPAEKRIAENNLAKLRENFRGSATTQKSKLQRQT